MSLRLAIEDTEDFWRALIILSNKGKKHFFSKNDFYIKVLHSALILSGKNPENVKIQDLHGFVIAL